MAASAGRASVAKEGAAPSPEVGTYGVELGRRAP